MVCLPRRAFSLVELVVVIVLLAIAAAVVLPRMVSGSGREVRSRADAIASLLSTAARRDSLTSQRVGVEYSLEDAQLRVVVLTSGERGSVWSRDPLTPPVSLGITRVIEATSNGVPLPEEGWRIELAQSGIRPSIQVMVGASPDQDVYRVVLAPGAIEAVIYQGSAALPDETIDLDAAGGEDSAW